MSPAVLESVEEKKNDHENELRQLKNELINSVNEPDIGVEIFTIELQRPLQLPSLPMNESYDLRCLWLFNLCIFDELDKTPYMYVWDETTGKKGPEEIASCLFKHIYQAVSSTTKKVIMYSDATDLYRNIQIAVMMKTVFDYHTSELESIEQRFFIPGHSTNDCNRIFDLLEKKIKISCSLFTPDDWIELMSSVRYSKRQCEVNKMCTQDFLSVEAMMQKIKSVEINWSDVKAIICNRSEPLSIRVKYSSRNTEEIIPLYASISRPMLIYNEKGISIPKAKYDDLIKKTLKCVPKEKQAYYENIQFDVNLTDEDFALASYSS